MVVLRLVALGTMAGVIALSPACRPATPTPAQKANHVFELAVEKGTALADDIMLGRFVNYHKWEVPIKLNEQERLDKFGVTAIAYESDNRLGFEIRERELYNDDLGLYSVIQMIDGIPPRNLPVDGQLDGMIINLVNSQGVAVQSPLTVNPKGIGTYQPRYMQDLDRIMEIK